MKQPTGTVHFFRILHYLLKIFIIHMSSLFLSRHLGYWCYVFIQLFIYDMNTLFPITDENHQSMENKNCNSRYSNKSYSNNQMKSIPTITLYISVFKRDLTHTNSDTLNLSLFYFSIKNAANNSRMAYGLSGSHH